MKRISKWILAGVLWTFGAAAAERCWILLSSPGARGECVVLLHGIGRTGLSMKPIEWFLRRRGYDVVNVTYPSVHVPVETVAAEHLASVLGKRVPARAKHVHFVTHSMGGIVLRQYLATHRVENLGRTVMLAPPNQGSALVDRFKHARLARQLTGPNLSRLGTAGDDLPRKLGPANFEVGVIAGDRSPVAGPRKGREPGDGKVTVENARLDGMRDFIVIRASHTSLLWKRETLKRIGEFLDHGRFSPGGD